MLASDVNNPEFTGAISNPDDLLHVEFYFDEAVDKWATEEESTKAGRKVIVKGPRIPFIKIVRPGDKTTEIVRAAMEMDKARFPRQWLAFQINEGMISQGGQIPGWSIDDWSELSKDQVRELKYLRFQVVEQIAGASDAQVQQMGMGGLGLREKAKQALREKMGAETKDALMEKEKEILALQKKNEENEARLKKLEELFSARQESAPPPIGPQTTPAETSKKRGWPKGKPRKPKESKEITV